MCSIEYCGCPACIPYEPIAEPKPPHKYKVGDTVVLTFETEISELRKDCDGTSLYGLTNIDGNWGENCLSQKKSLPSEPVAEPELKTSEEWQALTPDMKVIDPDGWDRKDFHFSWFEEKITKEEYDKRLIPSTISWIDNERKLSSLLNYGRNLSKPVEPKSVCKACGGAKVIVPVMSRFYKPYPCPICEPEPVASLGCIEPVTVEQMIKAFDGKQCRTISEPTLPPSLDELMPLVKPKEWETDISCPHCGEEFGEDGMFNFGADRQNTADKTIAARLIKEKDDEIQDLKNKLESTEQELEIRDADLEIYTKAKDQRIKELEAIVRKLEKGV